MHLLQRILIGLLFVAIYLVRLTPVFAAADPIAYWKFDDGSGSAPIDSSGNSITGSFLTPNPTWSTDVPSDISFSDPYSLDFSNYHDGVTFAWPSGLNFNATAARSFSFWYKPTGDGETDAGNFDRIISWDSDAFEIAGTFGSVSTHEIAFYDGSWRDTGYALTVGTWYHITFTYDGTRARFYVGNDLKYNQAEGGRSLSGTMAIGTRQNGHNEGINGRIDDVRVYNYALDATQIANLTAGSNNPDAPPATPTPTPAPTNTPTPTPTVTPTPTSSSTSSGASSTSTQSSCVASTINGVPNLYEIDPDRTSVTLYFTPVRGADGYTISYGITGSANSYATSFGNSNQSGAIKYTINSLSKNTTYYFKVKGIKNCSSSNWSQVVPSKTTQSATPISQFINSLIPTKKIDIVSSRITHAMPTPTPQPLLSVSPIPTAASQGGVNLTVKIMGADNKPVTNVDVILHSRVQVAKTDTNGIAHFTNVEKGEHTVMLSYADYKGEQKLIVDGNKKEETLTLQVKMTNGLAWNYVWIISVVGLMVVSLLLILLFKKRKKEKEDFKQLNSKLKFKS